MGSMHESKPERAAWKTRLSTTRSARCLRLFQPLLYQVATAGLSPADIAVPIRTILKHLKATCVLLDEVVGVDLGGGAVRLASGAALPYDPLVTASGARRSYFGNDQWEAHAPGDQGDRRRDPRPPYDPAGDGARRDGRRIRMPTSIR